MVGYERRSCGGARTLTAALLNKSKVRNSVQNCSEVWLIRTAYPCWIFLASTSALFPQPGGNVHASRLPPLLHRSGSSMWHRQRIKPKPKPHHHAPHASQDSNPTVSVIEAQATVQITPHSSPTIAMPILQSPPPVIINVVAAQPVQTHLRKRHASLPPDVPVPGAEARACGRS